MSSTYGYVVVSPNDRNEKKQIADMEKFGVLKSMIVTEKQSGDEIGRPEYAKLIRKMHRGDTLVIDGLRSLGSNYIEIVEQWRMVTKERGLHIAVLEMPLIDTRVKAGNMNHEFVTELVLQILTHIASEAEYSQEYTEREQTVEIFAEKERGDQRQQTEDITAAKEREVKLVRPKTIVTCLKKKPKKRHLVKSRKRNIIIKIF